MDESLKQYIKAKIANIQSLKTFIEDEETFIKCIVWDPSPHGLYPHEISMLFVLHRFLVKYSKEPVMNMCPKITDTEGCIRSLIERGFAEYTIKMEVLDKLNNGQLRHIISKANIPIAYKGTYEMIDAIKGALSDNDLQRISEDRYYIPTDKGREVIEAYPELFNETFDPWPVYSPESQKKYENISTRNLLILSNVYKKMYSPQDMVRVTKKELIGTQVNEFINVYDPSDVMGEGSYRLKAEHGEYYFWGKDVYVITEDKKYIHNSDTDDFYLTLDKGTIITVVSGRFTSVKNIEYRFSEDKPLKIRHMYRSGLEIPGGTYRYYYDGNVPQQEACFVKDGECKIESCKNFPSIWYDAQHNPQGYYAVDENTKYLWILNGRAILQSKGSTISNITRQDTEREIFYIQEKYKKMEADQSLIIIDDRFYFYVSIQDPITEVFINNYYEDITPIKSPFPDDDTVNYSFSVPKNDKEAVCQVLWLLIQKKLGLPCVYNTPVEEIYWNNSIKATYFRESNPRLHNALLKLNVTNAITFDRNVFQHLSDTYPAKLLIGYDILQTYAMELSPEFDKRYYYHTYNHESEYNKNYQLYLTLLAEKGILNPRWRSEFAVYTLVKSYYPDAEYQYRDKWLDKQSLDIYIPSITVGIEYQGAQHYEPVSLFGGDEGLKNVQIRDRQKEERCKERGVTLIKWKYDVPVKEVNLRKLFDEADIKLPRKKGYVNHSAKEEKKPPKTVIYQYDLEGNFVNEYKTITEACSAVGVKGVSKVIRGERKQSGGYIWRKVDNGHPQGKLEV